MKTAVQSMVVKREYEYVTDIILKKDSFKYDFKCFEYTVCYIPYVSYHTRNIAPFPAVRRRCNSFTVDEYSVKTIKSSLSFK